MQSLINFQDNYVRFDFETKHGQKIKIVGTYDDPYFCGKDVCAILEHKSIKQTLFELDSDYKKALKTIIEEVVRAQLTTSITEISSFNKLSYNEGKAIYVNEPGLYALIMKSRTSFAKTFQKFVYEQILPSIRKRGRFELEQKLQHQAQIINQKDIQLEQKAQQLEDQKDLVLRLNEMLVDSSSLPKTHVVYIATSSAYANQNRFKVGGVESLDKLSSRLSVYNSGSANGNLFYYADWFLVHSYREIETRLKDLMGFNCYR